MPNVKKPSEKLDYRRTIVLSAPVAERVEAMAEQEQRPMAMMLRILVERGIASSTAAETPQPQQAQPVA